MEAAELQGEGPQRAEAASLHSRRRQNIPVRGHQVSVCIVFCNVPNFSRQPATTVEGGQQPRRRNGRHTDGSQRHVRPGFPAHFEDAVHHSGQAIQIGRNRVTY